MNKFLLALFFCLTTAQLFGQLDATVTNVSYVVDFDATISAVNNGVFTGTGFQASPNAGQLDSDAWAVSGLSDGTLTFGGTQTAGDFARGSSTGGVGSGGIYAFEVATGDIALGIQPGGSDFTPGEIVLKVTNNTGTLVSAIDLAYDVYVYNDQTKSGSIKFEYSTDGVSYTALPALDVISAEAADASPAWVLSSKLATVSGLTLNAGGTFYMKWIGDDESGAGSRDEYAIDNIDVKLDGLAVVADQFVFDPTPVTIGVTGDAFDIVVCATDGIGTQTDYATNIDLTDNGSTATFTVSPSSSVAPASGCATFTITPTSAGILNFNFGNADAAITTNNPLNSGDITITDPSCIIISEVVDPFNTGDNTNRYVEIYNPTANVVDISGFSLEVYFNGNITIGTTITVPASTSLSPGNTYLFGQGSHPDYAPLACSNNGSLSFNGDDAILLKDAGGNIIDVFGVVGTDGTGEAWEYTNDIFTRKLSVTCGVTTWDAAEWDITVDGTTTDATPCEQGAPSCSVISITVANQSTCMNNGTAGDPTDDFYTGDVTVTFVNPPATGTLDLTGDLYGTYSDGTFTGTSHVFTGVQLKANGAAVSLTATFSDDLACTFIETNADAGLSSCTTPTEWTFDPSTPSQVFVGIPTVITICNIDAAGNLPNSGFVLPDLSTFAPGVSATITGPVPATATQPCFEVTITFDAVGTYTLFAADVNPPFLSSLTADNFNIGVVLPTCAVISEISASTASGQKYIEIFNPTCADMDISDFTIEQWSQNDNLVLTGTVPAATTLGAFETFVFAADISASGVGCGTQRSFSGNGDDTYILKDAGGRILDQYGEKGVDGSGSAWDYANQVVTRDYDVCCGNFGAFDNTAAGWTISAPTAATPCEHVNIIPNGTGTITADKECTDVEGWTHYYNTAGRYLLFSIKKNGEDIGMLSSGLSVAINANTGSTLLTDMSGNYVTNPDNWEVMNRYWQVDVPAGKEPTAAVNVKFYYTDADFTDVASGTNVITAAAHPELFSWKINDYTAWSMDPQSVHPSVPYATAYDQDGFWQYPNGGAASSTAWRYSTILDGHFSEYQVGHFGAGGLGVGGAIGEGALPVELLSFTAKAQVRNVKLNWATASETNNSLFEIEHSATGQNFRKIAQIRGNGTTSVQSDYEFLHNEPIIGLNYYRLKQIDLDGSTTMTPIRTVQFTAKRIFKIIPTIVKHKVSVLLDDNRLQGDSKVIITDMLGKVLIVHQIEAGENRIELDVHHFPQGIYILSISKNGISQSDRFVKR